MGKDQFAGEKNLIEPEFTLHISDGSDGSTVNIDRGQGNRQPGFMVEDHTFQRVSL
jgi:hypothetical protein